MLLQLGAYGAPSIFAVISWECFKHSKCPMSFSLYKAQLNTRLNRTFQASCCVEIKCHYMKWEKRKRNEEENKWDKDFMSLMTTYLFSCCLAVRSTSDDFFSHLSILNISNFRSVKQTTFLSECITLKPTKGQDLLCWKITCIITS